MEKSPELHHALSRFSYLNFITALKVGLFSERAAVETERVSGNLEFIFSFAIQIFLCW